MPETFNNFDLAVLILIGLSALLSFFRGFVREIFSLGSWLGASLIALYTFEPASKWIAPHVGSPVVASGLASIGVFFVALVLISIVTGLILKFIKTGNEVGVLDNLMGLLFGAARGVLIVAIAYFSMGIVMKEDDFPPYVKDAWSRPYVAKAAATLGKITPDYLNKFVERKKEEIETAGEAIPSPTDTKRKLPTLEDLQTRIREESETMP